MTLTIPNGGQALSDAAHLASTPDELAIQWNYPVLYVDDEEPNLTVFEATFGDDFQIILANSAEEALRVIDARPVAIVVADQRMPGMTGIDLCERIRSTHAHMLRMLITAYSDQQTAIDAINRGGVETYIVKPWDKNEVRSVLRAAVARAHFQKTARLMRKEMLNKERLAGLSAMRVRLLHDLGNIISVLRVAAEGLDQMLGDVAPKVTGESREDLEFNLRQLQSAVTSLARLYRQSRTTSHHEPDEVTELSTVEMLDIVAKLVWNELVGVARLTREVREHMRFWGDPIAVSRVLINLVRAAAMTIAGEAAGHYGTIKLVAAAAGSDRVEFRVECDGRPLAPELLAQVFGSASATAALQASGLGLVLGVSLDLARTVGGALRVEQGGDGWTTAFCLVLPTEGGAAVV